MQNVLFERIKWIFGVKQWFYFLICFSQVIGITAFVLVVYYFGFYGGGFSWQSSPGKEFNLHPVLMTLGLIFCYGDAILVYRVFADSPKIQIKVLHATLLGISLVCAILGLKSVFDSHNLSKPPEVNLYSLHSWIGLSTVILFGLQWIFSFITFLFPRFSETFRRCYMASHKFWGKSIFILAIISVVAGITGEAEFAKLYNSGASIPKRNVINVFGVFVVIFGLVILYLVSSSDYERSPEQTLEQLPLVSSQSNSEQNDTDY